MNTEKLLADLEVEFEACRQENRELQELNMKQGVLIKELRAQLEDRNCREEVEEPDARQRRVITQLRAAIDNHGRTVEEEVELLELRMNNDTLTNVAKALGPVVRALAKTIGEQEK